MENKELIRERIEHLVDCIVGWEDYLNFRTENALQELFISLGFVMVDGADVVSIDSPDGIEELKAIARQKEEEAEVASAEAERLDAIKRSTEITILAKEFEF